MTPETNSDQIYITTPIYYVTASPHIGTSYTTVAADILARHWRLRGRDVLFATGSDEHAQKVLRAANEQNVPVNQFLDKYADVYKQTWANLHIDYDRFIRTSEPQHKENVQHVFASLLESGDIYRDEYEGWYCVPCETYFRESELLDGDCPDCGRPVEKLSQDAYFIATSRYADRLLDHIRNNPQFILPQSRANEVISFIQSGLRDNCVTRKGSDFGVPVPGDEDHTIYVWFDALINYLTVAGYPDLDDSLWPPDVQLMGKDILPRFHATIWPAMLMALDVPLPKTLFAHGWWVSDQGDKISKSKGNIIDLEYVADQLADIAGTDRDIAIDAIRYFLMREVSFGLDGSFSFTSLASRFNGDLANDFGNIINRTLPLINRYFDGAVPRPETGTGAFAQLIDDCRDDVERAMAVVNFRAALEAVWRLFAAGNKFIDQREPWTLYKEGNTEQAAAVLYDILDLIRTGTTMLAPFMPVVASRVYQQLGIDDRDELHSWDACTAGRFPPGATVTEPTPIFPRIDMDHLQVIAEQAAEQQDEGETQAVETISYDEFEKMDLRVGRVIDVKEVPDADKLFELTVDLGEDTPRTMVAGIAQEFSAREVLDALVVVVANLEPATIRGVESNGMILAAGQDAPLALVTLDRPCDPGTKVR